MPLDHSDSVTSGNMELPEIKVFFAINDYYVIQNMRQHIQQNRDTTSANMVSMKNSKLLLRTP